MEKSSKRSCSEGFLDNISALLIEVDGILFPKEYCYKTLIDVIADNVEEYVNANYNTLLSTIDDLRKEAETNIKSSEYDGVREIPTGDDQKAIVSALANNVGIYVRQFHFPKCMSSLCTDVMKSAFESKKVVGKLYEDAENALKKLNTSGKLKLYALSKACNHTARLMLEYTDAGNMATMFADIYGPDDGSTEEKATYTALAKKLDVNPEQILYVTQDTQDVKIATSAGLKTCLIIRKDDANDSACPEDLKSYPSVHSLDDLFDHSEQDDHKSPQKKHKPADDAEDTGAKICVEAGCGDHKATAK